MISNQGYKQYNIWRHSPIIRKLYAERCALKSEEMACHAQAAELLGSNIRPGDSLLDVGCGSGYFYHSLKKRNLDVDYWGIDATEELLEIGRGIMPRYGLSAARLQCIRIEDLAGEFDHILCCNVLSNIDNFHRPLERMLHCARKTVILRESIALKSNYAYVHDKYLESDTPLFVHVNTYSRSEIADFIEQRGYHVRFVTDERTQGKAEMVIDYPHYWNFVVANKKIKN